MDKDTWALKLGKMATEAKERRSAAAAAQSREASHGETVREARARMQAEEARQLQEDIRRQNALLQQQQEVQNANSVAAALEALPENPVLSEFEHQDSELAGLQAQISALEGEKSALLSENAELHSEILSLRGKVEGLEGTVISLRDELAALRVQTQSHSSLRKTAALHVTQQMHRKRSK
jgi:polyhydroxyalkanoate synthesis regulator phasin